jgi:ferredoxin
VAPIDLTRRSTLGAAVGGVAALCVLRLTPQSRGQTFHPLLLRPPGSRAEREFLSRCTACGLCMRACPTGGLQPAWTEAGLEGLWTPRLDARIGYCLYTCNLCGQVCPTEAIQPLDVAEKQQIRIGLATFDTTRCIPYAFGRDCMVCEEHCPISDKADADKIPSDKATSDKASADGGGGEAATGKAIYFQMVEVQDRQGAKRTIKQPRVDPDRCVGCAICQHVCPLKDWPGIRVTSTNETRHPDNQAILPGMSSDNPYGT